MDLTEHFYGEWDLTGWDHENGGLNAVFLLNKLVFPRGQCKGTTGISERHLANQRRDPGGGASIRDPWHV